MINEPAISCKADRQHYKGMQKNHFYFPLQLTKSPSFVEAAILVENE